MFGGDVNYRSSNFACLHSLHAILGGNLNLGEGCTLNDDIKLNHWITTCSLHSVPLKVKGAIQTQEVLLQCFL